ncbi:anthranilate phosphoribosyltransferase [Methanobrevibacter filiformis]|uniref:Anthranilate phosphoribosyltransferase n=1 Tax=Methanobrevibacter filiformis TaxID=55758 RepID=A0A162FCR3_9EURY|nr:anthranilate phosphoribosyltransferase [Methanobrevibacter filiformis]KZX11095.1 anthranilate phosphoribosyltransferase [Methanobrevibacter filiformis]
MIKESILKLAKNQDISYEMAEESMNEIMRGKASDVQMSSYLTALSMKGETIDEITASAASLRNHCVKLLPDMDVLEIVGTGGDGSNSFNISTVSSIVISAGGIPVAKHGNRAASSKCGSADVLESLGVNIELSPEKSKALLKKIGICFLYAQNYHIAMKYVAPIRRELGIPTIFNILGPLSNPAGANMEVLGVYDESLVLPIAMVIHNLGVKNAMVVYGQDKLDEISICAPTKVCEIKEGKFSQYTLNPEDYGFELSPKSSITGGSPAVNAQIALNILNGEEGPKKDAVILNSAAGLYIGGKAPSFKKGLNLAETLIDDGSAKEKLENFINVSNSI